MNDMDYNVENYSIDELYELIGLDTTEIIDSSTINEASDVLIKKYNMENKEDLKNFFINVRKILLDETYKSENQETIIIQNEENNKIGDDIIVQNVKGNPNFNNIIKRMVNIDSSFRLNSFPAKDDSIKYADITNNETSIYSNTDFTCYLTEKLRNVVSMTMHSIAIPYSWYAINRFNNTFKIEDILITIEPGNYTCQELRDKLNSNTSFSEYGEFILHDNTCKIDISLNDTYNITFYEPSGDFTNSKSNYNFGWLLGFRNSTYTEKYISGEAMIDINGPKYLTLLIDEFKGNMVNKGIVNIETSENKLSLPSYFSNDMIFDAVSSNNREIALYSNIRKINNTFQSKTITKAQETTLNEIIKSRNETTNTKLKINNDSSIFAIIPFKKPISMSEIISIDSTIESNTRVYLGPINIEKLRIKLMDDKGNVLDLNGIDWSFTFITEHTY